MKNRIFSRLAFCVAALAVTTAAFAAPPPPVDDSVSQGSGIITPAQAVGAIRADLGFTYFKDDGGLAVCVDKAWSNDCKAWARPADFIRQKFPRRTYTGFQIFVLKDGPQLYLYYR